MYKFKVGDTVRPKNVPNPQDYVIQEITNTGWHRKYVGDKSHSYQAESLELVCPAGYRPVREDEMHERLRIGDAGISSYGVLREFKRFAYSMPYELALSCTDLDCRYVKFFRPIQQKLEWGWTDGEGNGTIGLTEEDAKAGAKTFSENYDKKTFVYKIIGKFAVKTETKVEWNEI